MSDFLDRFEKLCQTSYYANVGIPLLKYVKTGDLNALAQARKQASSWGIYWLKDAWPLLNDPSELTDEERRAMCAAVSLNSADGLTEWLGTVMRKRRVDEEAHLDAYLTAFDLATKKRTTAAAELIGKGNDVLLHHDRTLSAAGKWVLSLSDADLAEAANKAVWVHDLLNIVI